VTGALAEILRYPLHCCGHCGTNEGPEMAHEMQAADRCRNPLSSGEPPHTAMIAGFINRG